MCLILFAMGVHPDYPLIVAANRDEFHGRETAAADFWDDAPAVLAGRDLEAGGTWMGITRGGRFAAVTNFSETPADPRPPLSRGDLVADYLRSDVPAPEYLAAVTQRQDAYSGFNLLLGSPEELWYLSNRHDDTHRLATGTYGLSNHLLDTAWPRVVRGKSALADFEREERHPQIDSLLFLLGDDTELRDEELQELHPDHESPGARFPCFIRNDTYGTRSSTVLLVHRSGRIDFSEQRYAPAGVRKGRSDFTFEREG